jgi:carbamoyltransferase
MRILGISALRRDAAAALVVDGELVATAQEERLTKQRLASGMPKRAIRACLEAGGVLGRDIDQVVFYEKPLRAFERTLVSELRAFPHSARVFSRDMFTWLGDRMWVRGQLAEEVGVPEERVRFVDHELSHAAAAYYTSPFDEAAVLVLDDVGEWATTLLGQGRGRTLETLAELHHPHSLGLFASALTQFLGFEVGADERLVEALSAWGAPRFLDVMEGLLPAGEAGGFEVKASAFRFPFDSEILFGKALVEELGPHREPGVALRYTGEDRRDADLASSLQAVLETRALALVEELYRRAPQEALCLGGELAHNTRLVARILADGPFERLHVPEAPGKAGAALGAALYALHMHAEVNFNGHKSTTDLVDLASQAGQGAAELGDGDAARDELVARLADGQRVAWVKGSPELGVRSLRSRVLLADPCLADASELLLSTVQRGESYQPSCLAVLAEEAPKWLVLPEGKSAPGAMARGQLSFEATPALLELAPSAVSPDGRLNARLVDRTDEPEFAALLDALGAATGASLLTTASFHLRGAPIVKTELDAFEAFQHSNLDALVAETRLYART